ncbi:SpoIIE family protein phosphatase [Micromonospora sp. NPDC005299]|uniref:SpoIIE family protein phosphatase n=1 Tax=Micromonospora sp. NPDC005299 TaxID=3364231 RepID=UPI0036D0F8D7
MLSASHRRLSRRLVATVVLQGWSYVTAVLGRLDLRTGGCWLLNVGHVPPLLVRDGDTQELPLPAALTNLEERAQEHAVATGIQGRST